MCVLHHVHNYISSLFCNGVVPDVHYQQSVCVLHHVHNYISSLFCNGVVPDVHYQQSVFVWIIETYGQTYDNQAHVFVHCTHIHNA